MRYWGKASTSAGRRPVAARNRSFGARLVSRLAGTPGGEMNVPYTNTKEVLSVSVSIHYGC